MKKNVHILKKNRFARSIKGREGWIICSFFYFLDLEHTEDKQASQVKQARGEGGTFHPFFSQNSPSL